MRPLLLTLLFVVLIITSCRKDDLNYNYYSTAQEPEIESSVVEIDSTNIIFKQHIIETQTILLSTFVLIIRQAMFQPELYGLVNGVAQTRACPTPSIIDNSSGAGGTGDDFEKELTLTFVEAPSTTQCTANGIDYEGSLVVDFEAALGESDGDAIDVQLTQINSFVANGFSFSGGTIDLESDGGFGYTYTISGAPLVCSKGGVTTSVPVGTMGTFSITDEGEDITMPQLWVDNPFELSLDDALLTCTNAANESSTFCTDTEENIQLDPFDMGGCSCPVDGLLRIRDGGAGPCGSGVGDIPLDACNSVGTDFGDGTCTGNYTELESVIEFFYYESTGLTGTGGAVVGCEAVDMGVVESNTTTLTTESLQRTGGPGSSWTGPIAATSGTLNVGQTITGNPSLPWVNEIHYDNISTDVNEGIEIAGPAGLDLTDYKVQFINGNGTVYGTQNLSGVIDDEGSGYGALFFDPTFNIQNGAPDGFALVKCDGAATMFKSCN